MAGLTQFSDGASCWGDDDGCAHDTTGYMPHEYRHRKPGRPEPVRHRLRRAELVTTIESEIIPRLMLAHARGRQRRAPDPGSRAPDRGDVAEFARLILAHDHEIAASFVETMRLEGASLEQIVTDLLTPTARLLGDLWKADLCDFADVTIGLSRLQRLLRDLGPEFEAAAAPIGRRALLTTVPGEQHTFGVGVVEEFFRREGWDVRLAPGATRPELHRIVAEEQFDVVGLSLSIHGLLDQLASDIRSLRRISRNGAVGILVGGRIFVDDPSLCLRVGADATGSSAAEAVAQAEYLSNLRAVEASKS